VTTHCRGPTILGTGDESTDEVEPRVYVRGAFAVTLWTYYGSVASSDIAQPDYAHALTRLHAGLHQIDLRAPHFTDRVADAQRVVADREQSPDLQEPDRELLSNTLSRLSAAISARGSGDQLLHGEPHPGNLLNTRRGPLFVDLETCCLGPVEFDIAHAEAVGEHCPGVDRDLLALCRILVRAMVTAWRWDREDQFPDRLHWRIEGLNQLRALLDR
jgi:aminoglycoside phosphotransferase (APT) family kinase protein